MLKHGYDIAETFFVTLSLALYSSYMLVNNDGRYRNFAIFRVDHCLKKEPDVYIPFTQLLICGYTKYPGIHFLAQHATDKSLRSTHVVQYVMRKKNGLIKKKGHDTSPHHFLDDLL